MKNLLYEGWLCDVLFHTLHNLSSLKHHDLQLLTNNIILFSYPCICSKVGGQTNTPAAIKMIYEDMFSASRGDRDAVPNVVILVVDGGTNINQEQLETEIENLRNTGMCLLWLVWKDKIYSLIT